MRGISVAGQLAAVKPTVTRRGDGRFRDRNCCCRREKKGKETLKHTTSPSPFGQASPQHVHAVIPPLTHDLETSATGALVVDIRRVPAAVL